MSAWNWKGKKLTSLVRRKLPRKEQSFIEEENSWKGTTAKENVAPVNDAEYRNIWSLRRLEQKIATGDAIAAAIGLGRRHQQQSNE